MNFLANLLPGLREVRAPLATGYLWVLTAWLKFHDDIPSSSSATGVVKAFYDLATSTGPIAAGVAVSVTAYVVGDISFWIFGKASEQLGVLFRTITKLAVLRIARRVPGIKREPASIGVQDALFESFSGENASPRIIMNELVKRYKQNSQFRNSLTQGLSVQGAITLADNLKGYKPPVVVEVEEWQEGYDVTSYWLDEDFPHDEFEKTRNIAQAVTSAIELSTEMTNELLEIYIASALNFNLLVENMEDDYDLAPNRLVVTSPAMYERWDRLRAEADFRSALAPPLMALALLLGFSSVKLIIALLVALSSVLLWIMSSRLTRKARQQIVSAMQADLAESQTLMIIRDGDPLTKFAR